MALLRIVLIGVALSMAALSPASAQLGLAPAVAESQATAEPAASASGPAQALLDVLRDETARDALLMELERIVAGDAAAEAPPPEQPEVAPTIGRKLALLTRSVIDEGEDTLDGFVQGLRATQRRLLALTDQRGAALMAAGRDLLLLIAATVVVFLAMRRVARWLFRSLRETARDAPLTTRVLVGAAKIAIDATTVLLAWAVGNVIALGAIGGAPEYAINNALYLNAFLMVQLAKVAVRGVFAPEMAEVRGVPFTDAGARYWAGRLGGLISILGYGLLLVTPLVNQTVSIFTGRAVQVVIYALVLLWAMALVIRHRRRPAQWLAQRAEGGRRDTTLRVLGALARFWHWPMLVYLVGLFVTAVSQSGAVEPVLETTAKVLGVLALGAVLGGLMGRLARGGVHMPEDIKAQLPLLEGRLNEFISRFLSVARLVLLLATLGAAVQISGLYDISGWFSRRFGDNFGGLLVSVAVIVTFAFLLWLSLASWVDFRLNPDREDKATAREQTLLTLLRNAATILIFIITLMFTLSEIGLDIAPLLASAGVLGLAIGFGAQRMVQDIITGIFIQFENAINVGDVITVSGVTGTVEKLTIRSVSLRDLNGVYHIIPFSSVEMVSNFMRGFAFHVAEIGIAYRENVAEAKALMFKAFDDLRADPAHGPNMLGPLEWHGLTAFGDSAVTLRARIRTRPGAQWAVGRAYNEAVKRRFDEAGVEIPFPHMTVWFGEDKQGKAPPARIVTETAGATTPALATPPSARLSSPPKGQDAPNADGGDAGEPAR